MLIVRFSHKTVRLSDKKTVAVYAMILTLSDLEVLQRNNGVMCIFINKCSLMMRRSVSVNSE